MSNEQNNDKFLCSFSAPASPLVKSLSMGPLQCVKSSSSSSSLFTLCLDIVITAEIPVYFAVRIQQGAKRLKITIDFLLLLFVLFCSKRVVVLEAGEIRGMKDINHKPSLPRRIVIAKINENDLAQFFLF